MEQERAVVDHRSLEDAVLLVMPMARITVWDRISLVKQGF